MSRYLITTADEATWKFDRPVVFLGEWCRRFDQKNVWQNMDAIVTTPYGLGLARKDADRLQSRALEEMLFPILCESLNLYHGKSYSSRFWRILVGHWFSRYVDVIYNSVKALELCLASHEINGTTAYSDEHYSLATVDLSASIWAAIDDRWNNTLYSRILGFLDGCNFSTEVILGSEVTGFSQPRLPPSSIKQRILRYGSRQFEKLAELLSREDDAFIINSYLPKSEEIKLQLLLGQVPQRWTSRQPNITQYPDRQLRKLLSDQVGTGMNNALGKVLGALLFELLPICYLEGFEKLTEDVEQMPWPKRPKFIFTSNNFYVDEIFKLWTAMKVETGSTYIVGQHGSNYGTCRYMNPSIEEITADKFLTWGWTDGLPQHVPAFLFKTVNRKASKYDPNGGLLLIEYPLYRRESTWDRTKEFEAYLADQKVFAKKLDQPPRRALTVRLHAASKHLGWFEADRWREFDPGIRIEPGTLPIEKLVSQSRLVIQSYDSTGMLEALSLNIPTMAFWQNGLDHLRESAKPHYQLLIDAGIIHLSAESLAMQVNEVWDDVPSWWAQSTLQYARQKFCEAYAHTSNNPLTSLKTKLVPVYR